MSADAAIEALVEYGSIPEARAKALIKAWGEVATEEALLLTAGQTTVAGSQKDQRVETVARLIGKLTEQAQDEQKLREDEKPAETDSARPLNQWELASLWRVTPLVARGVLSTWRARHPDQYHAQMAALVKTAGKEPGGTKPNLTHVITFEDPGVYEYALEQLKRAGINKGLTPTRTELKIEVPQDTKSGGQDALGVLGLK